MIKILSTIDSKTLLSSGGIVGVLIRILASKNIRTLFFETIKKGVLIFFGKTYISHYLFDEKQSTMFLIENIRLKNDLKTDIFRIILTAKVEVMVSYSEFWVKKYNSRFKKMNTIDLQKRMKKLVKYMRFGKDTSLHRGYDSIIRENLINKYGQDKGIKYYNYVYLENFIDHSDKNSTLIDSFFDDMFFYQMSSNESLVRQFLNHLSASITANIHELKTTFFDINGELEKI